jgi:hypothetical protein
VNRTADALGSSASGGTSERGPRFGPIGTSMEAQELTSANSGLFDDRQSPLATELEMIL